MSLPICPCAERSFALREGSDAPFAVWRVRLQRESGLLCPGRESGVFCLGARGDLACARRPERLRQSVFFWSKVRALSSFFRGRAFRGPDWLPLESSGESKKKKLSVLFADIKFLFVNTSSFIFYNLIGDRQII